MVLVLFSFGGVPVLAYTRLFDAMTIGVIVSIMMVDKKYIINSSLLKFLIILTCITALSIIATRSSIGDYFGFYIRIISSAMILVAFNYDYKSIGTHLMKGVNIILVLSLINFILATFAPFLFSLKVLDSGYESHNFMLLFNWVAQSTLFGIRFVRNQGIYWEPGILQIVANIAVYYIIIEQGKSIKKALFPIFIILTTGSTSGFLILMMLFVAKFRSSFSLRGKGLLRSLGVAIVISAFIPILIAEVQNKMTAGIVSTSARLFDMMMALDVIKQNPITGIGMDPQRYLDLSTSNYDIMEALAITEERGNTNTILAICVNFGIPLALLFLVCIYKQRLFKHRFVLFALLFLALFAEPLLNCYFITLLFVSCVAPPRECISKTSDDISPNTLTQ